VCSAENDEECQTLKLITEYCSLGRKKFYGIALRSKEENRERTTNQLSGAFY